MVDSKMSRQVLAERLHAVTLTGMMTGCEIVDTVFAGNMHGGFGNLATDEGIQPASGGGFQVSLRCTAAPANAMNLCRSSLDMQCARFAPPAVRRLEGDQ